jgi:hypothetical protein
MTQPTRTFNDTIAALRYGTLADELTAKLRELVGACSASGRAGTLARTIKLKPGKGGQIEVLDELKVTLPKEEKGTTLLFATPDNALQREDPRQLSLDGLRTVDRETGEIRQVTAKEVGEVREVAR